MTSVADTTVPFVALDENDKDLRDELLEIVARVSGEGAFTLGSEVTDFEAAFAGWCGSPHAIGVSSGTSALELSLRALGIGAGDEVIVPANTFFATAEAVSAVGATPVLIDIDPGTALLTASGVEAALTPATRAVIAVHLYGRTVEMAPLVELCRARGLKLVEDACQAHGAEYEDRRVGTFGDAGCFSFYPTKNLGCWGDGGAVVTADDALDAELRLLRSHGEAQRHVHERASGTHRLHALQAAILTAKLTRLDDWNERRRQAARALSEAIQGGDDLALPVPVGAGGDHVFHLFVVRSPRRDALRAHLDAEGIGSAIHYPTPIHLQPAYAALGMKRGDLPVAERLGAESCSLPMFPDITAEQIARVAASVNTFS